MVLYPAVVKYQRIVLFSIFFFLACLTGIGSLDAFLSHGRALHTTRQLKPIKTSPGTVSFTVLDMHIIAHLLFFRVQVKKALFTWEWNRCLNGNVFRMFQKNQKVIFRKSVRMYLWVYELDAHKSNRYDSGMFRQGENCYWYSMLLLKFRLKNLQFFYFLRNFFFHRNMYMYFLGKL